MIRLSKRAIHDLRKIREYIEVDDPNLAARKIDDILDRCERLVRFPNMGRPGRETGTRELSINPWIVVYREARKSSASEDVAPEYDIDILAVWHSRQSRPA